MKTKSLVRRALSIGMALTLGLSLLLGIPLPILAQGSLEEETHQRSFDTSGYEEGLERPPLSEVTTGSALDFPWDDNLDHEAYAKQKEAYLRALGQRNAFPQARSIQGGGTTSNDYLEFAVDPQKGRFTLGTTGGNPNLNSDDNQNMLYGHPKPWTSYTTVWIDGAPRIYGDGNLALAPHTQGNKSISQANFGDVSVKQTLSFVKNSATGREDVVEIRYDVRNQSDAPKPIGLRIMLDTMLGSNDHAPFRLPGIGDVTTEHSFQGKDIPPYWQAFDSLEDPNVVAYGNFLSGEIKPTKVQFANWRDVYETPWNYTTTAGKVNGDSAVCVIWERSIPAQSEETYTTRYGLSELLQDLRPPLSLSVSADSAAQIDPETKNYRPYMITSYIKNVGQETATNVVYRVDLPADLAFAPGESGVYRLGTIKVGQIVTRETAVYIRKKSGQERTTSFNCRLTADKCQPKVLNKSLTIPEIETKAIIILPGVVGSRLFADQTILSNDYLLPEYQTKDYKGKVYTPGYMLWEPYNSTFGNYGGKFIRRAKIRTEAMMLLCDEAGESRAKIAVEWEGQGGHYGADGRTTAWSPC